MISPLMMEVTAALSESKDIHLACVHVCYTVDKKIEVELLRRQHTVKTIYE